MQFNRRNLVGAGVAVGVGALAGAGQGQAASVDPLRSHSESLRTKASGRLVQSYVMPAPLDATWTAFTDPQIRKMWWGHPTNPLEGAIEVRPRVLIRGRVDHPGLPGVMETSTTFRQTGGETLVTQTQTGFGQGLVWESAMQSIAHGATEMMGDMALYLKTGAGFPRHTVFRCFDFLRGTREVPGGLEVYDIPKGTLPDQLGMVPGDIVVAIAGAGVYGMAHAHFASRTHVPGDEVEVKWVRGDKLMTGIGRMTKIVEMRQTAS